MSKLDKQVGNKKIQLNICLNDQATIAWFTSIRGVYYVSFSSSKLCQVSLTDKLSLFGICRKITNVRTGTTESGGWKLKLHASLGRLFFMNLN